MSIENDRSFEDTIKRLEEIVVLLEKSDLPMERVADLYEEGRTLHEDCQKIIDSIKMKIDTLNSKAWPLDP